MAYQYPPNYSNGGQDAYYAYGQEYPQAQGYPGGLQPPDAGNAYAPPPPGRTVPPLHIPPPSRTPTPGYPPPSPHPPHSASSSSAHSHGPPSPHQQQQHSYPHHPYGPPSPQHQHPYGPPSPHQQQHPYGPPSQQQHLPAHPNQRQHSQPNSYRHQHQHSHSSNTHYQPYPTKQASGPEPGLPTMNPSSSSSSSTPRPEPGLPTMHPEKLSSRPEPGLPTMHPEKLSSRPAHRPASFGMTAPSYANKNKHRLSSERRRNNEGCNDCFSVCGCIRCTCTFCTILVALIFLVAGIALFGYSRTLPSRCRGLCEIGGNGNSTSDSLSNIGNSTSGITNGDINGDINGGQTLPRRLFDGDTLLQFDDDVDDVDVGTLERRQFNNSDNNPIEGGINKAENKCSGFCSTTVYNALRYTSIALLCIGGFMLACVLLTMFCRAAKSGGRGSGCLFCC